MENAHFRFQMPGRSSFVLGLKSATIVAAALVFFSQDLAIVANDALQIEFMSHILAIPFLFGYLIYRKRKMLRAVVPFEALGQPRKTRYLSTVAGIILSATAILVYWYGSYTFTPLEYHIIALPVFVAGLTLVLFNPQTLRQLAFPIVFLVLLIPPPSEILFALGSTLSIISSQASYTIITLLGVPSTLTSEYGNPTIWITRPNGATIPFGVDIACSGVYSLIGFLIFAVFIAYIVRDKLWKKLALFLIGFPLIYVLNITRITAILLIGYHYGEEIALQLFHLLGGWFLTFMGTLALLIFSEKALRTQIFARSTQKCVSHNPEPEKNQDFCLKCGRILKPAPIRFRRTDIVKIAAIVVTVVLLISIQAPVFALTEGPAQIIIQTSAGEQGNIQLLPQIQEYALTFVYRDEDFEETARQDASLVYAYVPQDETKETIWVTVEIGSSTSMLHRWEVCLVSLRIKRALPTIVTQIALKDIQIHQNPPIIARYFAFKILETNQTQAILYWYETARFMTNSTTQQKRVKISLIAYPETPQNIAEAENQLVPFAEAIARYWQPIKTWSQLSLLMSQNSAYLAAVTCSLLAVIIVLYFLETRKKRKLNAKAYLKLSKPNRQIIDVVLETQRTTAPTLDAIATMYNNQTGETLEEEKLLHKLSEAEKTGIIESGIASNQDEPTQVWKTQLALEKNAKTENLCPRTATVKI